MTTASHPGMHTYMRAPDADRPESKYEKPVILPEADDNDPSHHAWADARFAADIMAEHALFFALLMPEEVASRERAEALRFRDGFTSLFHRIDAAPPP